MAPDRSAIASAVVVLTALLLALALAPPGAAARARTRVVGGHDVSDMTTIPYQAVLYRTGFTPYAGETCGASIRDETHVLTAAHCIFDESTGQAVAPASLTVLAGTATLAPSLDPSAQTRAVARISFNPRFDLSLLDYDVAVLTLDSPLALGPAVTPIPIASAADAATYGVDGAAVGISGFGDLLQQDPDPGTHVRGVYPTRLQQAVTHIVSREACGHDYAADGGITARQLCAGEPDSVPPDANTIDTCDGDSGGPLTIDAGGTLEQLGIVSGGNGCAWPGFPGIYALLGDASVGDFAALADPVAAPRDASATSLVPASPRAGRLSTCDPGQWTGSPSFTYLFVRDNGSQAAPTVLETGSDTYIPSADDVGKPIFCEAKATNAGGYGIGQSSDGVVASSTAPSLSFPPFTPPLIVLTPTPQADVTKPAATLASRTCTRTRCTVNVLVVDPPFSAGIAGVSAKLTDRYKTACKVNGHRTTCTRTSTTYPAASAAGGGHYLLRTGALHKGTIALAVAATDNGGNTQLAPLKIALTLAR